MAEKDSAELWKLARVQKTRGHNFNATLLYASAQQTANRGPNFQMGIARSISDDTSNVTVPPDLLGLPPFSWKTEESTYKVMSVGPIAIGGKLYVNIVHEVPRWQSDREVDQWNKKLLNYFKQHFPEYSDVFAGLAVRAVEQGSNRGFGTVEELPVSK